MRIKSTPNPENQVLLDAARMLGTAQRIIKQVANASGLTPNYKSKLVSEARTNIEAALARLPED